ncbi:class I SAM-dependent methyltransferase [Marinigracilibium pacificum]|uniref:Class I SAM-dependent methyltransferase n=1 Tax=Marinigracilibium pacificum TaxID=2729599 RepID=A0A848J2X8_9BACT|nr:class I SAM-dependent methyltransferase [Marinigracilibium pacificum]NMM48844.1 class I SAM-dependent methyltransferase [Marinigracilibium pacificum]
MATYTTEIASDTISSDNPIHRRLLKAYYAAIPFVSGNLLEVGCGEGRGVELLAPKAENYTAVDKIGEVIERLSAKYPDVKFVQSFIPPFDGWESNQFDTIVTFQVIEHIKDDGLFLKELYRLLKPGGKLLVTTPNINYTLSRNPWHEREYTPSELEKLMAKYFDEVETKGIGGNDKVWDYYNQNKKSVEKITRFDIFNLQYKLPASILRIPYDILNRINRNNLSKQDNGLVSSISHEDYLVTDNPDKALDLFYIGYKK